MNNAIHAGYPAGKIIETRITDDKYDDELKLAFDFDGVLADDEAEKIYKKTKNLSKFHQSESKLSLIPHNPGPLQDLFKKISYFQKLENKQIKKDNNYKKTLKIAIVTARNAPAHERMINTLKSWGVSVDEAFFLGGIEKKRILEIMKPHMFFDDQTVHFKDIDRIPLVHVPFGIGKNT